MPTMNNDYCPNCNQYSGSSARCPICNQPESIHIICPNGDIECPSCLICGGYSDYGGVHMGSPSQYDGDFLCNDCLSKLVDGAMHIENS